MKDLIPFIPSSDLIEEIRNIKSAFIKPGVNDSNLKTEVARVIQKIFLKLLSLSDEEINTEVNLLLAKARDSIGLKQSSNWSKYCIQVDEHLRLKRLHKSEFKIGEGYTFTTRSIASITQEEWLQLKSLSLSNGFLEFISNWKLGAVTSPQDHEMFDWDNPLIAIATKNDLMVGWAVSVRDLNNKEPVGVVEGVVKYDNQIETVWVGNVFVSLENRSQGVGSQLAVRVVNSIPNNKTVFDPKVFLPHQLLEEFRLKYDYDLYSVFRPKTNYV